MIRAAKIQAKSEAGNQIFLAIGHPGVVVVVIRREERRVHDIKRARALIPRHSTRAVHRRKGGEPVGRAVAVGVLAPDDPAMPRFLVERPVFVAANEHGSLRRGADKNRVGNIRRRGEDRRLELRWIGHPFKNLVRGQPGTFLREQGGGKFERDNERESQPKPAQAFLVLVRQCSEQTMAGKTGESGVLFQGVVNQMVMVDEVLSGRIIWNNWSLATAGRYFICVV